MPKYLAEQEVRFYDDYVNLYGQYVSKSGINYISRPEMNKMPFYDYYEFSLGVGNKILIFGDEKYDPEFSKFIIPIKILRIKLLKWLEWDEN